MAAPSGKKGKKKGKTLILSEFLSGSSGSASEGTTYVNVAKPISWGDAPAVDDPYEESDYGGPTRIALPTAPRASRTAAVDLAELPDKPPFTAFVGNLSYDVDEEALEGFFSKLSVANVRLPRDSGRMRGFGYVEFNDRQSLIEALGLNDEMLMNRKLRINLVGQGGPGEEGRDSKRGFGYPRKDGEDDFDRPADTESNWRTSQPSAAPERRYESDRSRGYNDDFKRDDDGRRSDKQVVSDASDSTDWRGDAQARNDATDGFQRSGDESQRGRYEAPRRGYDDTPRRGYDDTPRRGYDDTPRRDDGPRRGYGFDGPRRDDGPRRAYDDGPRRAYDDGPRRAYDDGPRRAYDDGSQSLKSDLEKPREEPKERPKLQLQPRSRAVEGTGQPVVKSSVFGAAKPVDTAAREREVEQKLRRNEEKDRSEMFPRSRDYGFRQDSGRSTDGVAKDSERSDRRYPSDDDQRRWGASSRDDVSSKIENDGAQVSAASKQPTSSGRRGSDERAASVELAHKSDQSYSHQDGAPVPEKGKGKWAKPLPASLDEMPKLEPAKDKDFSNQNKFAGLHDDSSGEEFAE